MAANPSSKSGLLEAIFSREKTAGKGLSVATGGTIVRGHCAKRFLKILTV